MQEIYLNSLNRKINYPLWNNDLEHKDLEIIKQTLYDAYFESNLKSYCEEAAFIFAEWWKNHYAGEAPSEKKIVLFLGLPEEAEKDLYSAAKKFLIKYNNTSVKNYRTKS